MRALLEAKFVHGRDVLKLPTEQRIGALNNPMDWPKRFASILLGVVGLIGKDPEGVRDIIHWVATILSEEPAAVRWAGPGLSASPCR